MDRRRRVSRVMVGVLVLGALALGACSSGGDNALSGSTTTTSAPGTPITTAPEGEGESEGEECEGETPIWAAKTVTEGPDPSESVQSDDDESTESESEPEDDESTEDEPADDEGSSDDECEEGPVLGEGELQITLRWEGNADYDLHVIEPDGTEIDYTNRGPTDSGGRLDVDSNIGCTDNGGVENVYWEDGAMPDGHYTVKVVGYSVDGCEGGEYELVVKVRGEEVLNETGTVAQDEEDEYEFDAE